MYRNNPKTVKLGSKGKAEKKCKPVQKSLQKTIYEDKCMNVNQSCVTMFDNKFETQQQSQCGVKHNESQQYRAKYDAVCGTISAKTCTRVEIVKIDSGKENENLSKLGTP